MNLILIAIIAIIAIIESPTVTNQPGHDCGRVALHVRPSFAPRCPHPPRSEGLLAAAKAPGDVGTSFLAKVSMLRRALTLNEAFHKCLAQSSFAGVRRLHVSLRTSLRLH